ncbi:Gldg family protein [Candidatus Omnitrophota bacterium]
MAIKKNKRVKLLFFLGILCCLMAAGGAFISLEMSLPSVCLICVGLFSLAVSVASFQKGCRWGNKAFFMKRCFFLSIIFVLLSGFYVGVNALAVRFDHRCDVTRFKQHTLSSFTRDVIDTIQQPVQLVAFHVGLPPKYLEDLLAEYERLSAGTITTEIVDPLRQIGYAAQFGDVISGKEKKVIVLSGQERRDVDFTKEALTEEPLTNAIIRVLRKESSVYILTGHGEASLSVEKPTSLTKFAISLIKNNIIPKELFLTDETQIPEDCDVLMIAGPKDPYTEIQNGIIEAYLQRGGDALFLVEHTVVTTADKPLTAEELTKNPSLNALLNPWGISISSDVVVDLESHASSDVGSPATRNYKAHKSLIKGLDYTFYIRPRSIGFLSSKPKEVKVVPFVMTESRLKSWGETDRSLNVHFDEQFDRAGPVAISAVAWAPKGETRLTDTRLIVFTDADFLSDAYIDYYSNAQMGLNLMKWLSEADYEVFVAEDELQVARLDLTSRQKRMVAFTLFCYPVLILCAGMLVWMKSLN